MKAMDRKSRRRSEHWVHYCWGGLALTAMPLLLAQASDGVSVPMAILSSPAVGTLPSQVVREIDDPHTGDRWLLVRDGVHPGGPAQLILLPHTQSKDKKEETMPTPRSPMLADVAPGQLQPVIHMGDRLLVEEHSATVDTYLEAVALGPATAGTAFNVRLKLGGKRMLAVAMGPGRATLQAGAEAQP